MPCLAGQYNYMVHAKWQHAVQFLTRIRSSLNNSPIPYAKLTLLGSYNVRVHVQRQAVMYMYTGHDDNHYLTPRILHTCAIITAN